MTEARHFLEKRSGRGREQRREVLKRQAAARAVQRAADGGGRLALNGRGNVRKTMLLPGCHEAHPAASVRNAVNGDVARASDVALVRRAASRAS